MSEQLPQLLSKNYAPAVSHRIGRFPSRDQLSLATWLVQNPVGTNYALQILDLLETLAKKEESSPTQILSRILGSVEDDKLHPKEMGKKLRNTLHGLLHPQSTAHQQAFQSFEQSLALPKGVSLKPPKNFEGTVYCLEMQFSEKQELADKLKALLTALDREEWKRLEGF